MLYAIVAILIIIVDQWSKYMIAGSLTIGEGVKTFIPGLVSLVNVHNEGCAFGLLSGSDARIWFILLCAVFVIVAIVALAANWIKGSLGRWSVICVMAGGIGNCIDRIIYGYVQDMFKFDLSFLSNFAIFNVADIFITVGCLVFILYLIFGGKSSDKWELADDEGDDEEEFDDEKPEEPVIEKRRAAVRAEAPVRRSRRGDFEDEEEAPVREKPQPVRQARVSEETPVSRRPAAAANSRKARQAKYEDEYAQFKATHGTRRQAEEFTDPFAEWERAAAAAEPARPAQPPVTRPAAQPQPVNPAPRPAAPAYVPAQKPAAPKKAADDMDFSLDDILNEFK